MILKNCNIEEFFKIAKKKRVFCFGASVMPQEICEEYPEYGFENIVAYFVDNDEKKHGTKYHLKGRYIPIISIDTLIITITSQDIILITSKYYVDIYEQLQSIRALQKIECYVWPAVAPQYKTDAQLIDKIKRVESSEEQIPKKIHYFWFGKGKIPELYQKCIDSWKHHCPDYEIIRWDESNYDVTKNRYMEDAYKVGKWGFVPDYARLDVIYQYGGIYLDTDVEVLRTFDDLLKLNGFIGFESKKLINLGLGFGAKAKNQCIKAMLEDYDNRHFINKYGLLNMVASPFIQTEVLEKMGLQLSNQFQIIEEVAVLPSECFSPDNNMIPHITQNTYSIHHFAGSWTSDNHQVFLERIRQFSRKVQEI